MNKEKAIVVYKKNGVEKKVTINLLNRFSIYQDIFLRQPSVNGFYGYFICSDVEYVHFKNFQFSSCDVFCCPKQVVFENCVFNGIDSKSIFFKGGSFEFLNSKFNYKVGCMNVKSKKFKIISEKENRDLKYGGFPLCVDSDISMIKGGAQFSTLEIDSADIYLQDSFLLKRLSLNGERIRIGSSFNSSNIFSEFSTFIFGQDLLLNRVNLFNYSLKEEDFLVNYSSIRGEDFCLKSCRGVCISSDDCSEMDKGTMIHNDLVVIEGENLQSVSSSLEGVKNKVRVLVPSVSKRSE